SMWRCPHEHTSRGPQTAAPRGTQCPDPDRAQAGVDQDPRQDGSRVHGAAVAREERGPAHRVPGSGVPQHLRVLGGPRSDEPRRVAESVQRMGLRYATVTGVARDDLPDEGAWLHAETVRAIHAANPGTGVEILATDFSGNPELLGEVFSSRPEVFAHNVETVPRIFKRIRPAFRYDRSLGVITAAHEAGLITKSNLILGMGEERHEITQALRELRDAGCDIVTVTQ